MAPPKPPNPVAVVAGAGVVVVADVDPPKPPNPVVVVVAGADGATGAAPTTPDEGVPKFPKLIDDAAAAAGAAAAPPFPKLNAMVLVVS